MVNQSLRSRLMFMAILPALLAALVVGGYSLVNRLVDVRDTNAQRQQLVADSFAARLESTASCWNPRMCAPPPWISTESALPCMPARGCVR